MSRIQQLSCGCFHNTVFLNLGGGTTCRMTPNGRLLSTVLVALSSITASALTAHAHAGSRPVIRPHLVSRRLAVGPWLQSMRGARRPQKSCPSFHSSSPKCRAPPGVRDAGSSSEPWAAAGLNPAFKLSGSVTGEPSYTRLFTHETWREYTGRQPLRRWWTTIATWRYSTVLASLWPICVLFAAWGYFVATLPKRFLPSTSLFHSP